MIQNTKILLLRGPRPRPVAVPWSGVAFGGYGHRNDLSAVSVRLPCIPMSRVTRLLALFLTFFAINSLASAAAVPLPPKEKFHLFLLVGQSNMAGRGTVTPDDKSSARAACSCSINPVSGYRP